MPDLQNETPKTTLRRLLDAFHETFPDKVSIMVFGLILVTALFFLARVVSRVSTLFGG